MRYRSAYTLDERDLDLYDSFYEGDEGGGVVRSLASASTLAPCLTSSRPQPGDPHAPSSSMMMGLPTRSEDRPYETDAPPEYRSMQMMEQSMAAMTTQAPPPAIKDKEAAQHGEGAAAEPPATSDLLVAGGGDVFDSVLSWLPAHPGACVPPLDARRMRVQWADALTREGRLRRSRRATRGALAIRTAVWLEGAAHVTWDRLRPDAPPLSLIHI